MDGRHREIPQLFNDLRTSLFVTYFTGSFYSSRKILLSVKITLSLSPCYIYQVTFSKF